MVAESVTITFALSVFPTSWVFDAKMNEVEPPSWFATIVLVIELNTMKLYVYGPVPPEATELNVTDCPASSRVAVDGAIVALSAVLTVTSPESIEFADVGVVAESVTMTFDFRVFPIRLVL